jgi:hypothetical protein
MGKTLDNITGIFIDDDALNYACVNKPLEKIEIFKNRSK